MGDYTGRVARAQGRRRGRARQEQPQEGQGEDIVDDLPQIFDDEINYTEKHSLNPRTRRDYRRRIQRIIKFWKEYASEDYLQSVIREVPQEEYEDVANYFFPSEKFRSSRKIP